ncbi:MAG: hypothetical protein J0L92_08185 [Deltaproteobacteria bacterium]|nr:hypothetical protein [Deltaproteobacteria bacterium]
MSTKQGLAAGGLALAALTAGCSALFGGGRYTGGEELDAALTETDAPSGEEDAPGGPDAHDPDEDAWTLTCTDDDGCSADQFCNRTRSLCEPCDSDGDGLQHRACVERVSGMAWDCEPDERFVVQNLRATSFDHTLRAFVGPSALHVFYVSSDGGAAVRYARFGAGTPSDVLLGAVAAPGLRRYDAARFEGSRVSLVGYDDEGGRRYELSDDAVELTTSRFFGALDASGYDALMPAGPPVLVLVSPGEAFLGFSARWGAAGMGGRVVLDVGGDTSFGSHIATYHERAASPTATLFASGRGAALVPNDMTESNPFLLWAGDVRDFGSNHDPQEFDVGSLNVGQLAVARLEGDAVIVALGAVGISAGVRLAVGLASCTDPTECSFTTMTPSPQIEVEGMEQRTVAVTGVTSRSVFLATTAPDAFRVGSLEICTRGTACTPTVPRSVRTIAIPALPMPDTREVAVDLVGDPTTGRLTLGLARASRDEIQTARVDLCFVPD